MLSLEVVEKGREKLVLPKKGNSVRFIISTLQNHYSLWSESKEREIEKRNDEDGRKTATATACKGGGGLRNRSQ